MEEQLTLPATLRADSGQKRLALIIALLVPIPFIAILPIGQIELPRVDSYIPVVDTVILINDSITATLLLAHFSITRAPSLLALAAGFLFTALLIVPHALTLPGAFAPNGLLGAVLQTPAWLNELWHLGLPSAVIAYALLKRAGREKPMPRGAVGFAIFATVAFVLALTWNLLWLTTKGIDLLSPIMVDMFHSRAPWVFAPPVALSIIAMLLLWPQRHLLLNLWLLVVLEIWMFDALLFYKLTTRYSLLWYGGRAFATLAASLVLLYLLSQTTVLYGRLARSNMLLQRERDNKLMNLQAAMSSISHEIKQPLSAIAMNAIAAQMLFEQAPPNLEEVRSALNELVSDSQRTGQILDNIRQLFGKGEVDKKPVDVNDATLAALRLLRGELSEHGVAATVELASELPTVMGHRGQLQEVILNLAHNAIEAMATAEGDRRALKVRTKSGSGRAILVEVEDSGPGIEPGRLDNIFDAFVTTKPHGMGLGLAICSAIIERHGGKLSASSDGKSGALFQVVLPVAAGG
jgi:signal transduction histidine kinase